MAKSREQDPGPKRTERSPGAREAGLRALERLQEAFQVSRPYKDLLKTLQKKNRARK